jgi:alkanesulfonate monooxygenase SsuD/methylene tetrahydromethanopterin reductase-like flavin-dependent oxidoreductase (luciferase family)
MRLGLYLPLFEDFADPRRAADLAATAEEAGWDGLFVWDHMLAGQMAVGEAWTTLAAIAMATSQIRIGAMVTPLARRRPWTLARQISTVDRLSGGRLVAGIGLGDDGWKEFSAFGEVTEPRERGLVLDESLEILQGLLSGKPVQHQGARYTVTPGRSCRPRRRFPCRYGLPAGGPTASRWPGQPGCRAASRSSAPAGGQHRPPPLT